MCRMRSPGARRTGRVTARATTLSTSWWKATLPLELPDQLAEAIQAGFPTVKIFTTDITPSRKGRMVDFGDIWEVFQVLKANGGLGVIHSEDNDIVMHMYGKLIREGRTGFTNMAEVHNTLSEDISFRRVIRLAEKVGATLYMMHTSAASGVSAIREARARGVPIYGESLHQYMLYTSEDYKRPNGQIYHTYPSLKSAEDQAALWAGTLDGCINCVATDEICCTLAKKLQGARIDDTTGGNAGVEPRVALMYTEMVGRRGYSLSRFVDLVSTNAAKIMGLYPTEGRAGGGHGRGYLCARSSRQARHSRGGSARGGLHAVGRPQDGGLALSDGATWKGGGGEWRVEGRAERRQVAASEGSARNADGADVVTKAIRNRRCTQMHADKVRWAGGGLARGQNHLRRICVHLRFHLLTMTDAELRALLLDCLALWGVKGRVEGLEIGIQIIMDTTTLQISGRPPTCCLCVGCCTAPNRSPRVAPSIVALLTALRNALGAEGGNKIRIGASHETGRTGPATIHRQHRGSHKLRSRGRAFPEIPCRHHGACRSCTGCGSGVRHGPLPQGLSAADRSQSREPSADRRDAGERACRCRQHHQARTDASRRC